MTSLNTRTGWDGEQTGSNFTSEIIEKRREGFRRGREGRSASDPSSINVTPTSISAPSASSNLTSSSPSLPTPGGAGSNSNTELSYIDSPSDLNMTQQRDVFFRDKYDPMTGVRIASTLGGFFLLVLLTLLYKSKCKGKHSREPSIHSLGYPSIHPGHLMRGGQNLQLNGGRDFGGGGNEPRGGGGGGNPSPANAMPMTLLDSTCYGYMNQVHPANGHQPVFSNYYGSAEGHIKSPAVLLITAANSESSDEELSIVSATDQREILIGGPEVPPERINRGRNPLGPVPPCRQVLYSSESQCYLHPRSKSPPHGGKRNIDINVILPTPSISPSGSENFNMNKVGGVNQTLALFQASHGDTRRLLTSRSLSSENENDLSETNGEGEQSDVSDAQAIPFGCVNSSMFSLENLKYVDDTSSENIPTRGSDPDEQDQDTRSIGSDSVFACFEHNFDHIAPTYARRVSSVSGTSSGVLSAVSPQASHRQYSMIPPPAGVTTELIKVTGGAASSSGFGEGEETELRVTLTQAQVHHRDSFCSDLESVNDYMETGARRRSSSTQTTLSDLRQALGCSPTIGWGGGGTSPASTSLPSCPSHENNPRRLSVPRRRRSLSPHMNPATTALTTTSTGQHHLGTTSNSTLPFLSVTLHPAPPATLTVTGGSKGTDPMSPITPTNPPETTTMMMLSPTGNTSPQRKTRKRSFDAVKKALSLQCEDKTDAATLYTTSSNETTPTN